MRSTMQDAPLLIRDITRHGEWLYADKKILTVTPEGVDEATFAQVSRRAEQLAAALTRLGVGPGHRVASFMWNNQAHMEAYIAVPCMGAVLHTLNIRLFPEQLAFVINHGGAEVLIVDHSLVPVLAKVLGEIPNVRHIIVNGPEETGMLGATIDYETMLAEERPGVDWPDHDGPPQGRRVLAPLDLAPLARLDDHQIGGLLRTRPVPAHRADVPRERVGGGLHRLLRRYRADHPPDVPPGRAHREDDPRAAPDDLARGAHHLERRAPRGRG